MEATHSVDGAALAAAAQIPDKLVVFTLDVAH